MKKKVDDKKKVLPATPSPVPSPSADAPSPGNTPPLQDMDDNEQIDMDLDEEQDSTKHNGKCKRPVWAGSGSVVIYGPG